MKRLLVTGAAGQLGRVMRKRLASMAETIRLADLAPLDPAGPNEECMQCDLADADAVDAMVAGCDGIVHLGGISVEKPFEQILQGNIIGLYNLYEAARAHGQPRIVFASSNHTIGYYPQTDRLGPDVPFRPDGLYGVSKCFGENLARLYFEKFGQETALVRIGSCTPEPNNYRMLSTWFSHDDFVSLIEAAFRAPFSAARSSGGPPPTMQAGGTIRISAFWDGNRRTMPRPSGSTSPGQFPNRTRATR